MAIFRIPGLTNNSHHDKTGSIGAETDDVEAAVFVPGEEVLGFAEEVILWKKIVVNNFVCLQSVLKYNLLNQISYINVSNNA